MQNLAGRELVDCVSPFVLSGGNLSINTAAIGTDFVPFPDQPCNILGVLNTTGTTIVIRQDNAGAALPLRDGQHFSFNGIRNASQISVRRADSGTTPVTVFARWES